MKKLDSKLFESLKLTEKEAQNTIGGAYTLTGQDTKFEDGSGDVTFETLSSNGAAVKDANITSPKGDDRDQPLPTSPTPLPTKLVIAPVKPKI